MHGSLNLAIVNCFDKTIKKPKNNKEDKHDQTKDLQKNSKEKIEYTHLAKLISSKAIAERPRVLKVEKLRLLNIERLKSLKVTTQKSRLSKAERLKLLKLKKPRSLKVERPRLRKVERSKSLRVERLR